MCRSERPASSQGQSRCPSRPRSAPGGRLAPGVRAASRGGPSAGVVDGGRRSGEHGDRGIVVGVAGVGQQLARPVRRGGAGQVRPSPRGPGRKKTIPQDKIDEIVDLTPNYRPEGETHWSCRTMAAATWGVESTVQQVWSAPGLKPHRVETFKLSSGYGMLLGALGVGAVLGALTLPVFQRALQQNALLVIAALGLAVATAVSATVPNLAAVLAALLIGGTSWLLSLATLNASMQLSLPAWVRARGLSVYQLIFMGGQAVGSLLWGVVAGATTTAVALLIGAGLLVA